MTGLQEIDERLDMANPRSWRSGRSSGGREPCCTMCIGLKGREQGHGWLSTFCILTYLRIRHVVRAGKRVVVVVEADRQTCRGFPLSFPPDKDEDVCVPRT